MSSVSKGPRWVRQIYWDGGEECIRASASWEQAAKSLEGLVKMGRVNFAHERALAARLAPANAIMAALGYPAQVRYPGVCK